MASRSSLPLVIVVAILVLVAIWFAPLTAAAESDAACVARVSEELQPPPDAGAGRAVQAALAGIYHKDAAFPAQARGALSDGRIGPVTRQWLVRFCRDFRLSEDGPKVLDAVVSLARRVASRPDWHDPLLSPDLGRWIDAQPADARSRDRRVRVAGSDEEVRVLLENWKPRPKASRSESNTLMVYYRLTLANLTNLAAPAQALAVLAKAREKLAPDRDAFTDAVAAVVKGAGLSPEQVTPIVVRHAEATPVWQITEDAVKRLRVQRVPAPVVEVVQSVVGLPFPDLEELTAALEDAAGDANDKAAAGAPPPSPPALAAATPAPPVPPPAVDLARHLGAIRAVAVESRTLRLSDASLANLAADPEYKLIPIFVVDALRPIEEVEYPTLELFEAAVNARIAARFLDLGEEARLSQRDAEHNRGLKLPERIAALGAPPEYVTAVDRVRRDAGKDEISRALRARLVSEIGKAAAAHRAAIVAAAWKSSDLRQPGPIDWKSNDCGCVQTDRLPGGWVEAGGRRSSGIVYGLFPLWQAGREQRVDFSVLSTVGYFAIGFKDDGTLIDPLPTSDTDRAFIREARRHGTRVDWVVRQVDWETWSGFGAEDLKKRFSALTRSLATMLNEPEPGWFTSLVDRLTFGAIPHIRRGDGVTLYFDHYPEDEMFVQAFGDFYRQLETEIAKTHGSRGAVNLLIPRGALGKGIFQCDRLASLLYRGETRRPEANGKFLVLLPEPTIDTKKDLRLYLENCLTGEHRRVVQQTIVPVVQYDGYSKDQLQDDIVYFDFNFGGVALWPHPVGIDVAEEAQKAGDRVTAERIGGDVRELLLQGGSEPRTVDARLDPICNVVCPNRAVFRGLFEAFVLVVFVSFIARWASCRLRYVLASRPLYFVLYMAFVALPTLVLFLALLYCDPAWSRVREGNIPFLMLAIVFFVFVVRLYVNARREAQRP